MSILFSAVTITADGNESEFLVGGIPREMDDLEGWTKYHSFIEGIDKETEVCVHAEAYLYGEGETNNASPEEIAYFMARMDKDSEFLSKSCDNIEDVDFNFIWPPEELCEMEMK